MRISQRPNLLRPVAAARSVKCGVGEVVREREERSRGDIGDKLHFNFLSRSTSFPSREATVSMGA